MEKLTVPQPVQKSPILWNPKVHYHIHKCPPPVPIINQINPVPDSLFHFLMTNFNIILPSTPRSCKLSLSLGYPYQNPVGNFPVSHTCHMPSPSYCPSRSLVTMSTELSLFHLGTIIRTYSELRTADSVPNAASSLVLLSGMQTTTDSCQQWFSHTQ